ncbi:MAG TPA: hypothetical protein VFB45_05165 [Pseudolabrys sp.]|nr:hypothetical protein [Pseudolabrys sp.]
MMVRSCALALGAVTAFCLVSSAAMAQGAMAQTAPPTYKGDPDVYKLIFEDANFRVIEAVRKKGVHDKTHGHPVRAVVYNLTDCKTKVYTPDGKVTERDAKAGTVAAVPIIPAHSAENVDSGDCRQIFVERK